MNTVFYAGDCVAKDGVWVHHYYEQTLSADSNQENTPVSTNFECLIDSDDSDFIVESIVSLKYIANSFPASAITTKIRQRVNSLFKPPKDQLI